MRTSLRLRVALSIVSSKAHLWGTTAIWQPQHKTYHFFTSWFFCFVKLTFFESVCSFVPKHILSKKLKLLCFPKKLFLSTKINHPKVLQIFLGKRKIRTLIDFWLLETFYFRSTTWTCVEKFKLPSPKLFLKFLYTVVVPGIQIKKRQLMIFFLEHTVVLRVRLGVKIFVVFFTLETQSLIRYKITDCNFYMKTIIDTFPPYQARTKQKTGKRVREGFWQKKKLFFFLVF